MWTYITKGRQKYEKKELCENDFCFFKFSYFIYFYYNFNAIYLQWILYLFDVADLTAICYGPLNSFLLWILLFFSVVFKRIKSWKENLNVVCFYCV